VGPEVLEDLGKKIKEGDGHIKNCEKSKKEPGGVGGWGFSYKWKVPGGGKHLGVIGTEKFPTGARNQKSGFKKSG